MDLAVILTNLGISLTANVIYDLLHAYVASTPSPTVEGLCDDLASHLKIDGARAKAQTVVDFFARNGDIIISNSIVHADDQVTMQSSPRTKVSFGDNSKSTTNKTGIEAGLGAQIKMQGGAKIVQNPDGSISFFT